MRIIEKTGLFTYKEVKLIRHEARTANEHFDEELKKLGRKVNATSIFPIGLITHSVRFWEFFVHPKSEIK